MSEPRIPERVLATLLRLSAEPGSGENWRMAQRAEVAGGPITDLSYFGKEPFLYSHVPTIMVDRKDLCGAALEYVEGYRAAKHETKVANDRAQRMRIVLSGLNRVFRYMEILNNPALTDEDRKFIESGE